MDRETYGVPRHRHHREIDQERNHNTCENSRNESQQRHDHGLRENRFSNLVASHRDDAEQPNFASLLKHVDRESICNADPAPDAGV